MALGCWVDVHIVVVEPSSQATVGVGQSWPHVYEVVHTPERGEHLELGIDLSNGIGDSVPRSEGEQDHAHVGTLGSFDHPFEVPHDVADRVWSTEVIASSEDDDLIVPGWDDVVHESAVDLCRPLTRDSVVVEGVTGQARGEVSTVPTELGDGVPEHGDSTVTTPLAPWAFQIGTKSNECGRSPGSE